MPLFPAINFQVTVQLRENSRGLGAGVKRSLDDIGGGGSRTYLLAKTRERFARINTDSDGAKQTRTFPTTQTAYRGKGRPTFTPALSVGPVGARKDHAPAETEKDQTPVRPQEDRSPAGPQEDRGDEQPPQPSTQEAVGSSGTAKDVDMFAE